MRCTILSSVYDVSCMRALVISGEQASDLVSNHRGSRRVSKYA